MRRWRKVKGEVVPEMMERAVLETERGVRRRRRRGRRGERGGGGGGDDDDERRRR